MPLPTPKPKEPKDEFISRCMGNATMVKEYDQEQRAAICYSQWRDKHKKEESNPGSNLAAFAEKLTTGKWLIKPAVHANMCRIVDAYMRNPGAQMNCENIDVDIVKGQPGEAGQIDLHGVIYINGIISKDVSEMEEHMLGLIDIDWICDAIDDLAMDESVKDIILCWASPGGETTGVEELGRRIVAIDKNIKPIYSWCENQADSAAYWLSSQARFYGMIPSAQVGGVGVYILVEDETRKLQMEGVSIEAISSGKYKMLGHEFRSLTKEERAILQEDVNKQHELFKATILARRPKVSPEDMEGLSFNGPDALQKGFVDVLCDSLREFIGVIDQEKEYMKPQVTKVAAMAAQSTAKNETKAEVVKTASTKKVSLIERLKALLGDYDGGYAEEEEGDLPGLPGVKDEEEKPTNEPEGTPASPATPTDYTEKKAEDDDDDEDHDVEDHEEPDAGDMEEKVCESCGSRYKVKKVAEEEEEELKPKMEEEEEEEEEEVKPPVKADYRKAEEEEEGDYDGGYAKSNPITREALMKACGIPVPPKTTPAMESWKKACEEVFTGRVFDEKKD